MRWVTKLPVMYTICSPRTSMSLNEDEAIAILKNLAEILDFGVYDNTEQRR